ncbi:MAG TPA: hypothetical protein VFJ51_11010 [Nitrososphaeraceae archaeon]|nr:hypothetical protein [Nitrososphaeraceae archaeon]
MGTDTGPAKIADIIHGADNVINTLSELVSNAKYKIDTCVDYTRPYLSIEIEIKGCFS